MRKRCSITPACLSTDDVASLPYYLSDELAMLQFVTSLNPDGTTPQAGRDLEVPIASLVVPLC